VKRFFVKRESSKQKLTSFVSF